MKRTAYLISTQDLAGLKTEGYKTMSYGPTLFLVIPAHLVSLNLEMGNPISYLYSMPVVAIEVLD